MKKRIICLLLVLIMCFSTLALAACNKDDTPDDTETPGTNNGGGNGENNNDPNENGGSPSGPPTIGGGTHDDTAWWEDITYDTTTLLFQMTKCDNNQELPSGCERYLAGESSDHEDIDRYVDERNEDAETYTLVNVVYSYVGNVVETYGFTKNIDRINTEVSDKNQNTPDIYCNFMTDMLCTSLLGSFANVRSRVRGSEQDQYSVNYFDLDDPGYMSDLMSSLTLSTDKIYVIASDYFIDLIRAFFVVPVNVIRYNEVAAKDQKLEDYTYDGVKDINDFFEEVKQGKWTYDRVAEYAAAAYKPVGGSAGSESIDDQLGFVLAQNGLPAAGMVYTSSVVIIHKEWQADEGKYKYWYPDENDGLTSLATKLSALMRKTGVMCVTQADASSVGQTTQLLGVRNQFTNNKILFGGVILVGSIEYPEYQKMKEGNSGGFGVVPVPVYEYDETKEPEEQYLTQIHVVGRAGGIAVTTRKFAQCTAFLHYQSSHSTEILNNYYDYNLTYDAAGGSGLDGNVDMLKYIRANVRTSFDKLFEDAIGFFFKTVDDNSDANRWHALICDAQFEMDNMADKYESLIKNKQQSLSDLIDMYTELPD